jgi:hypothetical protein
MSSRSSRQNERLLNLFDEAKEKIQDSDTYLRARPDPKIILEQNTFYSPPNPTFDYAKQQKLKRINSNIQNVLSG